MLEIGVMITVLILLLGAVPWWAGFGGFFILLYILTITKP